MATTTPSSSKAIIPGGPLEQYFGLKIGDKIIEISHNGFTQRIHDINIDPESEVLTAYQSFGQLTVLRDGKQVILPAKPVPANATAANASANPGSANPSSAQPNSAADALKGLNIPTH